MRKELELQLKEWGCPYYASDPKCLIWLEGYRAGSKAAYEDGKRILKKLNT